MTTNKAIYQNFITANGYYCNWCDKYHDNETMLHRATVEYIGEYQNQAVRTINRETLCPECKHDDIEIFDPMQWSHLKAYLEKNTLPLVINYPLFDRDTLEETGRAEATTAQEVEEYADWYCIEVNDIRFNDDRDIIVVTVEIC